jgi:hypothetical protein
MSTGFDRTIAIWDRRQPKEPVHRLFGHHAKGSYKWVARVVSWAGYCVRCWRALARFFLSILRVLRSLLTQHVYLSPEGNP